MKLTHVSESAIVLMRLHGPPAKFRRRRGTSWRSTVSAMPTTFNLVLYLDNLRAETDVPKLPCKTLTLSSQLLSTPAFGANEFLRF